MKVMSDARFSSLQMKIRVQALAIEALEKENRQQAERIAGLEALLYSAGVMDKEAFLAEPVEKAWLASVMLAGVDERTREREGKDPSTRPDGLAQDDRCVGAV